MQALTSAELVTERIDSVSTNTPKKRGRKKKYHSKEFEDKKLLVAALSELGLSDS